MRGGRTWLWSFADAIVVTVLGGLTPASFLLFPGLLIVSPIWPEGIHTNGPVSSALWPFGFYLANGLFWTLVVRLVLAIVRRLRFSGERRAHRTAGP